MLIKKLILDWKLNCFIYSYTTALQEHIGFLFMKSYITSFHVNIKQTNYI